MQGGHLNALNFMTAFLSVLRVKNRSWTLKTDHKIKRTLGTIERLWTQLLQRTKGRSQKKNAVSTVIYIGSHTVYHCFLTVLNPLKTFLNRCFCFFPNKYQLISTRVIKTLLLVFLAGYHPFSVAVPSPSILVWIYSDKKHVKKRFKNVFKGFKGIGTGRWR